MVHSWDVATFQAVSVGAIMASWRQLWLELSRSRCRYCGRSQGLLTLLLSLKRSLRTTCSLETRNSLPACVRPGLPTLQVTSARWTISSESFVSSIDHPP